MKAIIVKQLAGIPTLEWGQVADVSYGPQEVLVNIRATAINRADLAQAAGNYPPPPGVTDVLGLEMAGEVAAVGQGVEGWQPGDRVCALLSGGGYAEQVAVHPDMLNRLPDSWSYAQGAAVPVEWLTAYVNLFLEGGLAAGEVVLIHAGGSGVGTAAVQLAVAAGATALVTAGTAAKLASCQALGAALAINYKEEDFLEHVLEYTAGAGVHLILDPVGAAYLARNLRALRENGRLVQIGLLSGQKAELNMGLVLGKSLRLIGSRLRPRSLAEKIEITSGFGERFWPLLVNGTLAPVIDRVFAVQEAQEAHQYVYQNRNIGKVILDVAGE